MHNGLFPIFIKGRTVKKEALEYMRDFPLDFASAAFSDHSNGILFGFTISYSDDKIIISKGTCKYQNEIIVIPEVALPVYEYGQLLYINLEIGQLEESADYDTRHIGVKLTKHKPSKMNELELGRFSLNQRAKLRCKHDSFRDLQTLENTLNIIHVPYASVGGHTLNPVIIRKFADELLVRSSDAVDVNFALMCLNGNTVHRSSIQWFIAKKTGGSYEEYDILTMYEKLNFILGQHDPQSPKPERTKGRRPIIT
jgi:hypothetical protein